MSPVAPKCRDHLDEELGWAAAMRSPFKRYVEELIEAERKEAAKRWNRVAWASPVGNHSDRLCGFVRSILAAFSFADSFTDSLAAGSAVLAV